jgi:hypothetical protein
MAHTQSGAGRSSQVLHLARQRERDDSRVFTIDKAVVCRLDLMLPLCHGVKYIKEVTIACDIICVTVSTIQ